MAPRKPPVLPEDLTPLEALMMEVLIARWRLGEPYWTFPKSTRNIAQRLADKRLVSWQSGVAEGTIHVTLGKAGTKPPWTDENYTPPILSGDRYAEGVEDGQRLIVGILTQFLANCEETLLEINEEEETSKTKKMSQKDRREAKGILAGLSYAKALAQEELNRNTQETYNKDTELQELLTGAAASPTVRRARVRKTT